MIDLHAARLAFLRQEFRIGKARADHQQRVALRHQFVARLGAEQADRAGHPRQIVGQRGLAEQRLGGAGSEPIGDGDDFVGRVQRAGADQYRDFLAGVEHVGGAAQVARRTARSSASNSRRRNAPCRACAAGPR